MKTKEANPVGMAKTGIDRQRQIEKMYEKLAT